MRQDWPITSLKREWWPIIFIVFFETVFGRDHSGEVSKKFIDNFFLWGITLTTHLQFLSENLDTDLTFGNLGVSNSLQASSDYIKHTKFAKFLLNKRRYSLPVSVVGENLVAQLSFQFLSSPSAKENCELIECITFYWILIKNNFKQVY